MSDTIIDCRSEEGVTIGLIDSLISIARVLSKRDLKATDQIREALKDLTHDEDVNFILSESNWTKTDEILYKTPEIKFKSLQEEKTKVIAKNN